VTQDAGQNPRQHGEPGFCKENQQLREEFLSAVRELVDIQKQQAEAVIDGADFARFDTLLHAAQERKEQAKYAWIAHVEFHRCEGA
jgi:hypothetical protein